jgi:hypothetical protein
MEQRRQCRFVTEIAVTVVADDDDLAVPPQVDRGRCGVRFGAGRNIEPPLEDIHD